MTAAVLLAEPEPSRGFLEHHLSRDGFEVVGARAGEEALELVELQRPDLVLLGFDVEVCRRLRESGRDVPVIVLGEPAADAVDRVRAFAGGCDDYLVRPFLYEELVARIRAVLRRSLPAARAVLEAGEIRVDLPARTATLAGRHLRLAAKEYALLVRLAREPERVFTKEELLREVWGFRSLGRTRTIDSHASRLRRKLAEAGGEGYVLNEWGVGYRLLAPR